MGQLRWIKLGTPPATFLGNPNVQITQIFTSGGIVTSRDSDAFTAQAPYPIHCSASAITATGTTRPFEDLEFRWTVTGPEAGDTFTRPTDGATVNSFTDQIAPEAAFFLRTPGTYTITLNIRGQNGASFTTASVSKTVSFVAFNATGGTWYLDSTASAGGNGLTQGTAFNTVTQLNAVLNTAGPSFHQFTNIQVLVKNGSTFTTGPGIHLNENSYDAYTGVRFGTYSTGAKPVFSPPADIGFFQQVAVSSSSVGGAQYDVIVQGLSFKNVAASDRSCISVRPLGSPLKPVEHVYFDNCDAQMIWDTHPTAGYVQVVDLNTADLSARPLKKCGFWKCSVTNAATTVHVATGISGSAAEWFFVYGTAISGQGTGAFDHHIYPDCRYHELYKWNSLGTPGVQSNRGMSLNLNWDTQNFAPGNVEITRWHVVSENTMCGTDSAVDLGNRGNNYGDTDGVIHFTEAVIERNAMFEHHLQGYAMQLPCAKEATVRDNRYWGSSRDGASNSFISPQNWDSIPPGNGPMGVMSLRVYRNRIHVEAVSYPNTGIFNFGVTGYLQSQQWTDNIIGDYRASAGVFTMYFSQMIAAGILIDRNQIWTPNSTNMAYDSGTSTFKTYATYRSGTGFDPNGSNTNPGWAATVSVWADLS